MDGGRLLTLDRGVVVPPQRHRSATEHGVVEAQVGPATLQLSQCEGACAAVGLGVGKLLHGHCDLL